MNGFLWMVPGLPAQIKYSRWRPVHTEFLKMSIFPYWMKIFAHSLVNRCNKIARRCPSDQKRNRKLIRMTSSVKRREHVGRSQRLCEMNQMWYRVQETDNEPSLRNVLIVKIRDGGSRHMEFRKIALRQTRLVLGWVTVCGRVNHLGM